MPIYSCAIVGTGSDADPFRPPFSGEDRRIGWICLGAPGTNQGRGLLYLPTASADVRIRKIADDPTERASAGVRTVWQNELGISLRANSTTSFAALVAEIMKEHGRADGTRWGTLLPSKIRRRHEIYLGGAGLIWAAGVNVGPSTQTFTETWPTNSTTISSGQDQSWTEVLNDAEVSGGVLRCPISVNTIQVRCDSVLDTSAQYHQCDFALTDGVTLNNSVNPAVRYSDNNNYYRVGNMRRSTTGHERLGMKRVASTNTTIVTGDTNDPGASGVVKVTIDGSTMTINIGAYEATGTDGAPQLTTNFKGGLQVSSFGGLGQATADNHTIADVVSAMLDWLPGEVVVGRSAPAVVASGFGPPSRTA